MPWVRAFRTFRRRGPDYLSAFSFLVESKELQMLLCPKTKGSRGHILFRMDQDLRIISEVKVETAASLGLK